MPEPFDYLERRLRPQRDWHNGKAVWSKRRYYFVEVSTLLSSAVITIVNVGAIPDLNKAVVSAILGGVVFVAAGIGKLFKFQENWKEYRVVTEALEREEEHYRAGVKEYKKLDEDARNKLLVERTESLLHSTTSHFLATHRSASDSETAG